MPIWTNTCCYVQVHTNTANTYQYVPEYVLEYIQIRTNTYRYIPIHTGALTNMAPYLRSARAAGLTELPICFRSSGLHRGRMWPADSFGAPSCGAGRPHPIGDRPRKHESARWGSPWARTCPRSHALLLWTLTDMHQRPQMNLRLAGAHAVAPGLRRVGLFLHVLVCIYMYSYVSWHVLRYVLWYVSGMYCSMPALRLPVAKVCIIIYLQNMDICTIQYIQNTYVNTYQYHHMV